VGWRSGGGAAARSPIVVDFKGVAMTEPMKLSENWSEAAQQMERGLHRRLRKSWWVILFGMLMATGRRTISSWLRAAGVVDNHQGYYYAVASIGRKAEELGRRLLVSMMSLFPEDPPRVDLIVDDTPSKRFGPKVQGAGIHHNPTPGPSGASFCYGHIWVTLAVLVKHAWGVTAIPSRSLMYIRKKDGLALPESISWVFQTKLELAVTLVREAVETLHSFGKRVRIITDGGYTKKEFVREVMKFGVILVGRLRKDAALWDLPPDSPVRRRGRPRIYGLNKLRVEEQVASNLGWTSLICQLYGETSKKLIKTFLATSPIFGCAIRVVIVKEARGFLVLYSTKLDESPESILEAFADRTAIEQTFHDIKEVWGASQQQVRDMQANIGAWHLNLWMYAMTEIWGMNRTTKELVDRSRSPWDDPSRRPSHADRRRALQASVLREEFSGVRSQGARLDKFQTLFCRLFGIRL
jgi:hypothetical protein